MERDTSARTEDLLAGHVEWVRALARRIAGDDASAEDLAQDALVVALRSGPRASLRFRPWIAAVMRNLVRQETRGSARRESREERAARPESGERLVDEVVAGRELAQAVLDLPEPYRTALLMRFWENAPPREIAQRLDVPVATVNSRLARGLARLRERYDESTADEPDRLAALLPLLVPPPAHAVQALPALSLGGLVLNAKLVLSAIGAVVVAAVLWSLAATRASDAGHDAALAGPASAIEAADVAAHAVALDEAPRPGGRAASAGVEAPVAAAKIATPAKPSHAVRGIVLDADGSPLAGLTVGSGATSARSNGGGRFAFETEAESLSLAVLDEGWAGVRDGSWRASSTIEPVVVAARAVAIAGSVVDGSGGAIQDARVELVLPSAFDVRFTMNLEASRSRTFTATSDANGHFDLGALPQIPGARVRALREGWLAADVEMPQVSDPGVQLVMSRPEIALTGALGGVVVDARGDPVAEARVFLGLASTTTDERGRFSIELARAVTADRIVAVKSGRQPGILERPRPARDGDSGWPAQVEIVLGPEPLSIRGVVRDDRGNPREGIRVSIADPSAIGTIGRMPATSEGLASGAMLPPVSAPDDLHPPKQDDERHFTSSMSVGPPTAFWNYAITDVEGRFEIGGLSDRRYKLRVADPKKLVSHTTAPISAGERSADVRLPAPSLWPEVRGVVVDDRGEPIAGVTVGFWTEAYAVRARILGGEVGVSLRDEAPETVTDAEGRFRLTEVPKSGSVLEFASERSVPRRFDLTGDVDPLALEIEIAQRCSFEVRVAAGAVPAPDAFSVLDARGESLAILRIEPGSTSASSNASLAGGKSGVMSISSEARTLVLQHDGATLRTIPIRLRADGPNVIDV